MKFSHKVVAGALSVALMGSVLYISSSNESDYVEIQNQVQFNNKKKVDLQAEKKEPIIQDAPPGQNSGGSSSSSSVQVKGNGKLITDVSKNPIGAPLYDGLTRNDPLYETDYESIRSSNQNNPLKDLGDYSRAGQGELITVEYTKTNASEWSGTRYGAKGAMGSNRDLLSKTTNGKYWMINGRLAICMTGMVVMSTEDRAKVEPLCSVGANYTYPGSRSGITGRCYEPSSSIAPSWHNDSKGAEKFNFDVDIVLDNGTVLAATIVEYKGIQIGYDSGASYDCTKVKGYCHYQGNKDNTNWRVCSLELQTSGSIPGSPTSRKELCLEGHKIIKVVIYPGSIKWR